VIDTALNQQSEWHAQGLNIPVSINIAARHLQHESFIAYLREKLAIHADIAPSQLELEILETSALEDMVRVSEIMRTCREIGVRFALDDFGTGYSSLTYLKRLPADTLKIDQSFVHGMLDDPDDLAIVEGVLGLATAFRRQVIAEGVETVAHGEILLPLGCELAQGYGIARPMPAAELPAWVKSWQPDAAWIAWRDHNVNRVVLPLLFAETEHRAWVKAIEGSIKGEREMPQILDEHHCRFGIWYEREGQNSFGKRPDFKRIAPTHQHLHQMGAELLALYRQGQQPEALRRLDELHAKSHELIEQLEALTLSQGIQQS
jgi:EAL domain-containing protein (putative c-di-GMP-specific phosphodiesterase class I)